MRSLYIVLKMKLKGFALFEIAISLAIMGMIIGLSFPMLTKLIRYNQTQTTHTNQEIVMHALSAYATRNEFHLPCPALDAQGIAPAKCDDGTPQGIVPYATLNISKSYALDGFGRFMTYAVTSEFTRDETHPQSQKYCNVQSPTNPITLSGTPPQYADPIAVLLVSHGSKGHGAFNQSFHKLSPPSPTAEEEENANGDGVFIENSSAGGIGKFDHIVKWASQGFFAQYYMKHPCLPKPAVTKSASFQPLGKR